MTEVVNQQQLEQELDTFDIDDYLMEKKARLDKRIQAYHIRVQALKITRGYIK